MSAAKLALAAMAAIALSFGSMGPGSTSELAAVASDNGLDAVADQDNQAPETAQAGAGRIRFHFIGPRRLSATVTDTASDDLCVKAKTKWFKNGQLRDVDYSPWACPNGDSEGFTERAGDGSSGYFRASKVKIFKCFDSHETAQTCNRTPRKVKRF